MDTLSQYHADAALGLLVLAYVVYSKLAELSFRKNAVQVSGTVLRVAPHQHFTSHFVSYRFGEESRVAEYCGPPMSSLSEGDSIATLIDPKDPPNTQMPQGAHDSPGAPAGNCSISGRPLLSWWDYVYAIGSIAVIARSFA